MYYIQHKLTETADFHYHCHLPDWLYLYQADIQDIYVLPPADLTDRFCIVILPEEQTQIAAPDPRHSARELMLVPQKMYLYLQRIWNPY